MYGVWVKAPLQHPRWLKTDRIRLLLVESSVIIIFYVIFLMRYAVIINDYFVRKNVSN